MKKVNKFKRFVWLVLLVGIIGVDILKESFAWYEDYWFKGDEENTYEDYGEIKDFEIVDGIRVHYIDVGQGDSIFIELPNEETMLIDAGEASYGEVVTRYLEDLDVSMVDYLIGTHPHTDHIGGLSDIINSFNIGKIYMPKVASNSKTYENLLTTIRDKGLKVSTTKAGIEIVNENKLKIEILSPIKDTYSNLNNYSIVLKITYDKVSFLFMGDAEVEVEKEILADVKADVIKVGHHGSDSSSSDLFIDRVRARYAIVMVGEDNSYKHPSNEIINKWLNIGAVVYRTDLNGNIVVVSDGNLIEVHTSK